MYIETNKWRSNQRLVLHRLHDLLIAIINVIRFAMKNRRTNATKTFRSKFICFVVHRAQLQIKIQSNRASVYVYSKRTTIQIKYLFQNDVFARLQFLCTIVTIMVPNRHHDQQNALWSSTRLHGGFSIDVVNDLSLVGALL